MTRRYSEWLCVCVWERERVRERKKESEGVRKWGRVREGVECKRERDREEKEKQGVR